MERDCKEDPGLEPMLPHISQGHQLDNGPWGSVIALHCSPQPNHRITCQPKWARNHSQVVTVSSTGSTYACPTIYKTCLQATRTLSPPSGGKADKSKDSNSCVTWDKWLHLSEFYQVDTAHDKGRIISQVTSPEREIFHTTQG